MTEMQPPLSKDRKPEKRSPSPVVVALVAAAGGLVVMTSMGWAALVGMAMVGVILFFIGWIVYSQFDWRRAQVSLSTAVILMFVAGGLLWANTRENRPRDLIIIEHKDKLNATRVVQYGWPFIIFTQYEPVIGGKAAEWTSIDPMIVVNSAIALAILYVAWLLCEGRVRRKLVQPSVLKEGTK